MAFHSATLGCASTRSYSAARHGVRRVSPAHARWPASASRLQAQACRGRTGGEREAVDDVARDVVILGELEGHDAAVDCQVCNRQAAAHRPAAAAFGQQALRHPTASAARCHAAGRRTRARCRTSMPPNHFSSGPSASAWRSAFFLAASGSLPEGASSVSRSIRWNSTSSTWQHAVPRQPHARACKREAPRGAPTLAAPSASSGTSFAKRPAYIRIA
jgi:hypothetical protein